MTISCSRCKVKRVVGKTDFTIADLSNYKTCISCRNKLKEYRRVHVKKRRRVENEKKNSSDDRIDVSIVPSAVETKKAQGKKKAIEFKEFLEIIYNDVKRQDLVINETVLVDNFTLPRNMTGLTGNVFVKKKEASADISDLSEEGDDINVDNELNAHEETVNSLTDGSTYLLSVQINKDEMLKNSLTESFEVHYIDRIRHVLRLCECDFKFYVSSWKNGKYYASFRCSEDKSAFKRFGVDTDQISLAHEKRRADSPTNEPGESADKETSLLKSKLLEWVEPTDVEPDDLNLKIENEPVNSRFHSSFGYFCGSKMNLIVDYSKLEFQLKFAHKHHRLELKYMEDQRQDSTGRLGLEVEKESTLRKNIKTEIVQSSDRPNDDDKEEHDGKGRENAPNQYILADKDSRLSDKLDKLHKTLEEL
ncbi:hypothetical protein PICMEDRAFT_136342 [Pichia membranifaciens NRRL Y-2026]|uniref:Uncharacterized protein n=1 Tax=Pichia membranifaciens NRRL Y-2026 TaxID=763406 RepID=A0A1E3NKU8_9ASCO|nr:hypothetical protein PICMEDRAFT_136342 [Pichia membranifaciens NRRL Y-2026]ODQ46775.1 hypothetical protein PICMEDRAFT_136342 [Pichia membranifaciens NRRL Y-2026]